MLIAPRGAIGGEIFRVHENMLMIILDVSGRVYQQMFIRDSEIGYNDIAEELSGVDGLMDPFYSPGLVVPSY